MAGYILPRFVQYNRFKAVSQRKKTINKGETMKNISNNVKKAIYLKNYIESELLNNKSITLKKGLFANSHIIKHLSNYFNITTNDKIYYTFKQL